MRKAPIGVSILRLLAPEKVKEGIVFAVPPQRIELGPWLVSHPIGAESLDDLVDLIWSFGLQEPLLGRAIGHDRYQLVAEREFLEAAEKAERSSVRLHVVNVDDALGRAIALAARMRMDGTHSISALRAAFQEAGVVMNPEVITRITSS